MDLVEQKETIVTALGVKGRIEKLADEDLVATIIMLDDVGQTYDDIATLHHLRVEKHKRAYYQETEGWFDEAEQAHHLFRDKKTVVEVMMVGDAPKTVREKTFRLWEMGEPDEGTWESYCWGYLGRPSSVVKAYMKIYTVFHKNWGWTKEMLVRIGKEKLRAALAYMDELYENGETDEEIEFLLLGDSSTKRAPGSLTEVKDYLKSVLVGEEYISSLRRNAETGVIAIWIESREFPFGTLTLVVQPDDLEPLEVAAWDKEKRRLLAKFK